ncbi:MAG: efflux RND transporter periplasmic adaptor subunit [Gemmobacter sp.]
MSRARLGVLVVVLAVVVAALVWALRPDPVPVDLAEVRRGPMVVTVGAEGMTRIREPFAVTAPIAGTTSRSPVEVGDRVERGRTVVAEISPAEPALLDARARAQAQAAVTEAEAAVRLAEVNLARAETDLDFAAAQLDRNRSLAARGIIPQRMLDDSEQAHVRAKAARDGARSELDLHRATLARMQAQLLVPETVLPNGPAGECCVRIVAPVSGVVLSVEQASARLVTAGAPLLEIGDPTDLEVVVDLLSSDAVRVRPGARAMLDRWGGPDRLEAVVRRVEPSAFTRVSALGIEEQRVPVVLDLVSPPEARPGLGHRFRVFVEIAVWEETDVLRIPEGALFRRGDDWAVFRQIDGRAVQTVVSVGQRNGVEAQVLDGLQPGESVVLFPGDRIADGTRIVPRPNLTGN